MNRKWAYTSKWIFAGLLMCCIMLSMGVAQALIRKDRAHVREGNEAYQSGDYVNSGSAYQKALSENALSPEANYNLGNALYQQQKLDEAALQFQRAASMVKDDPKAAAAAYHNLGNTMLKKQDVKTAVEAYKQALRLNPNDEDTRYNLSYALKMMQQPPQQNQNQDQNQDQEQEQQDQDQQQQQDQQENQEEQANEQQSQQSDPQEQKSDQAERGQQLSEEEIKRMLEALMYQEDKLQEKLQRQKVKAKKVDLEKDW